MNQVTFPIFFGSLGGSIATMFRSTASAASNMHGVCVDAHRGFGRLRMYA